MNLDLLRAFFVIADHGSLNRAAGQLHVSQSTLTRQMQALEEQLGGRLLERGPDGVAPTAAGLALREHVQPVLAQLDVALAQVRGLARGQSSHLRMGYLASASAAYLHPALARLRQAHPEVKVSLLDLSPGQQIDALRAGRIDVGLIGQSGSLLTRDYYVRRLARLPVFAAVAATHPLAARQTLPLSALRGQLLVGAVDADLPGHNRWVTSLCRRAGFRARFVHDADSLVDALATVVSEGAVLLVPDYARTTPAPGIAFVPISDAAARWDLLVAWQKGKLTAPLRTLLDAFPTATPH